MATVVGSSVGYAPGAATAATLVRSVLDYCQGADAPSQRAVALRELNMAIDECNSRNWKKLISSQTITTVASDPDYDLDDAFRDPLTAHLHDATGRKLRLGYAELRTFLDRYEDYADYASPEVYTINYDTRQFVFQGTPDATFVSSYPTVVLHYYRRLAYLAEDGDVHGGPPEFNAFLVWQARAGYAAIRGDSNSARYAEAKAKQIYAELRRSDGNVVTDWE